MAKGGKGSGGGSGKSSSGSKGRSVGSVPAPPGNVTVKHGRQLPPSTTTSKGEKK